jgi:DHA2 family multidrug resistance protein
MGCVVTSVLSFAYLLYRELTTPAPLLDLRVFRYPIYNLATLVSMIVGLGLFGATFLVPIYLGGMLGYSALQIGLLLLPGSLAMGVMMLLAGRLSDLIDSRLLLLVGLAFFGLGIFMQAQADMSSPDSLHVWAQVWRGVGIGLCFSPLSAICMRGMPPSMIAQATGLFNLTRQLAGSIGIAALNTVLTSRSVLHATMLGQGMSAQAESTQAFLQGTRAMLIARGMAPSQADLGAFSMLGSALKQQVAVLAYADLFYILLAIALIGFLPLPFLGGGRGKARAR